ncbi:MAG: hydratase [Alsobacter sp.]
MFSPYYHWAGRREPEDHCAVNVALYGPGVGRWSMSERGRSRLWRDQDTLSIGPSVLRRDGDAFVIDVAEVAVPIPRPLRGRIRLSPHGLADRAYAIDGKGRHRWMPLAPSCAVEVDFAEPSCRWRGHGYVDTNAGDEPVADAFTSWDWSRADLGADGSAVLYDVIEKDGSTRSIAARYDRNGVAEDFAPPPRVTLPRTRWLLPRRTQAEPGGAVRVARTLEDTPFYARSELETRLFGRQVAAVHESLSVGRLDTPVVRMMLPFRMPRRK